MDTGYYWLKEAGEPWKVVEIEENEMYFTGSDVGATRAADGQWHYTVCGPVPMRIEQLVKIEPPND